MSSINERITSMLSMLPEESDVNLPTNMVLTMLRGKNVSNKDLMNLMVEYDLLHLIRQDMEWHLSCKILSNSKAPCITRVLSEGIQFPEVLLAHITENITTTELTFRELVKSLKKETMKPTETKKPTETSEKATETKKPTETSEKATETSEKPTETSEKPTETSEKATETSEKPTEIKKRTETSEKPTEIKKRTETSEKPTEIKKRTEWGGSTDENVESKTISEPFTGTIAVMPPSTSWKTVGTVMKKDVQQSKKEMIAVHEIGAPAKFVPKATINIQQIRVSNNKPANLDKKIASAAYVFYPINPPKNEDDDMFSWSKVRVVEIGGKKVVLPHRYNYESNVGWSFVQCEDNDIDGVGWYTIQNSFYYTHYMGPDGVWRHYYIEGDDCLTLIPNHEMRDIVARNRFKIPRE